jgi:hypothetical protein
MPNWCDNQITITGPNSVIDKIEKIVKEEENIDLSSKEKGETPCLLQFMYPMPKELDETTADGSKNKKMIKKHGYSSWYDWRVENWSTKWDVNEFYGVDRQYLIEQSEGESTITFAFSSAWAPPLGAYEHFIDENSNVTIRASYFEGGCDFMGIWDNGIDDCWEISSTAPKGSTDKFWKTSAGKELNETFNITEGMAEYEAQQEEERIGDNKEIIDYSKGEKVNV